MEQLTIFCVALLASTRPTSALPLKQPECAYTIHDRSDGELVRNVAIGQPLIHRWTCVDVEGEDMRMLAHSCYVDDGSGVRKLNFVDSKGCNLDAAIFTQPSYSDGMVTAEMEAFRYEKSGELHFVCKLKVGTEVETPVCANETKSITKGDFFGWSTVAPKEVVVNGFSSMSIEGTFVAQTLTVNEPKPPKFIEAIPNPECEYTVRDEDIDGPVMTLGKVGSKVYHRFDCPSDTYGMLVYSCFTMVDGVKQTYVDEYGCSVNTSLFAQPVYDVSLNMVYMRTTLTAVQTNNPRFRCQVHLCVKEQGGCEGVTPPKCEEGGERKTIDGGHNVEEGEEKKAIPDTEIQFRLAMA